MGDTAMSPWARRVGFRRTQPWQDNPRGIGWAFWVGPVIVSRLQPGHRRPRVQLLRDMGYVGVSAFGICVSVTR